MECDEDQTIETILIAKLKDLSKYNQLCLWLSSVLNYYSFLVKYCISRYMKATPKAEQKYCQHKEN